MKSLQKRKANGSALQWTLVRSHLDESPFEQEGKSRGQLNDLATHRALNESPSEKEGKYHREALGIQLQIPQ